MKRFNVGRFGMLGVVAILFAVILIGSPTSAAAASSKTAAGVSVAPVQDDCFYAARYVADVTIPDNTILAPGAAFTKTWRIRNTGSCTWGSAGYALNTLTFVGGTRMANSGGVPLPPRVLPGEEIDISIPMVAPSAPGTYLSKWMLQQSNGAHIGFGASGQGVIYAQIIVSGNNNPPPPSGICGYYTVRYGDTLRSIAARFGTTWLAIAQANHIWFPNLIFPWMRLAIPCGQSSPPSDQKPQTYVSPSYHYTVDIPLGWSAVVYPATATGPGTNPEYVTFSPRDRSLPQIAIHVATGAPPFTGYDNCDRNLVFRGYGACSLSIPAGQNPATKLLIFQRADEFYHIAMSYEDPSALTIWDTFLRSFQFN